MNRSPQMQASVETMREKLFGKTEPGCCVDCKQPFSDLNVHTEAGWRETRISGLCEDCWDWMVNKMVQD